MGDMTIRVVDEALARRLTAKAARSGLTVDDYVVETLREAVQDEDARRFPFAHSLMARERQMSPISSVDLLRAIRDGEE